MSQPTKKRAAPKAATKTSKKSPGSSTPTFKPGSDPLAVVPALMANIVPALSGWNAEPATFDVTIAEGYQQAYGERLTAIAPDRIRVLRLDVDAVCGAALTVHSLTQAPSLLARYQAAAETGEFNLDNLEALKALSFVVLDARRRANAAGAFASTGKVSPALDKESAEVEARMEKVCEHCFWDDAELGPTVQALHPGTSYQDRAYDLLGYADIYGQRASVVAGDAHYRASDIVDARRLAGQLLAALSAAMTPQARQWYDTTQRAWTLLELVYNEVRELGLRFLRCDPMRNQRLPSLFVVGRASTGRKKGKKEDAAAKPEASASGNGQAAKAAEGKAGEAKSGADAKAGGDAKPDGGAKSADAKSGADAKAGSEK